MKYARYVCALSAALTCLAACDEDTANFGVTHDTDIITSTTQNFSFTTRSVPMDSIVASSTYSYLGKVTDPETGATVKAEFAAQFHTFENYQLPDVATIVKNADGEVEADSVEVRLYYSSYYGDGSNPMRIAVYELDPDNVMSEGDTFYSDVDLEAYLPADAKPLTHKVFTASDYSLAESERTSTTHYDNVRIKLPVSLGTRILNAAIHHPEYFTDSWQFTHNVLPGMYFQLQGGSGTMLKLDVAALNVYFRYEESDSTYVGVARFSATQEVIQSTSFENSGLEDLIRDDVDYSYLKTPAGIATEITLPVDEVYSGHERDSVSRARLILTRYNAQVENPLSAPSSLLMVKKADRYAFFADRRVADGVTSYTTSYDKAYNTYSFSNIARMLAHLYHEKQQGMATERLTSEQWNAAHPDWNKVLVIPVSVTTTTNQSTGLTTQVAVSHDFSLSSVRLVGGTKAQQMQVIYSSYK